MAIWNKYKIIKQINSNSKIKTFLTRIEPIVKEIIFKNKEEYYIIIERIEKLKEEVNIYEIIEENEKLYIVIDNNEEILSKIDKLILCDEIDIQKEGIIEGHGKPITKEKMYELFNMEKSMCKIEYNTEEGNVGKATGFFCEIDDFPIKYALFTNNHILNESNIKIGNTIIYECLVNSKYTPKKIKLKKNRKVFTNKILDYTCVELLEIDDIKDYFEIEPNLFQIDKNYLKNNDIFILQYPNGNDLSFSSGKILKIGDDIIRHNASTEKGSSGSPIIRRCKGNYIIGIHHGYQNNKYNLGTLFDSILNNIKQQYNEKNYIGKKNEKENENSSKKEAKEIKLLHNYNLEINNINKKLLKENIDLNLNIAYREEAERIHGILEELISFEEKEFKGINYNIKNLLLNSDIEEIKGIIYKFQKDKVRIEEVIYKIIEKISLVLPQDILILQKFNGFESKYPLYSNKIFEGYLKGHHNNLRIFLEKMENLKNVIYTFTNITEYFINFNKFKNPILGEISTDSITDLKIDFKSENELENKIEQFLINDNKKICLINFTPNEGNLLNYIKFFIENKEKYFFEENKKENKKAFIFIVHLYRIFNFETKNGKETNTSNKLLKESISLLSDYYQIFIDNLNGDENISLKNILELKGSKFFNAILPNTDTLLQIYIFKTLSYMKYDIPSSLGDLNEVNYVNKLIYLIENNPDLRKEINDCIMKAMDYEDNIIIKIFKSKFSINPNDIDLINIIKRNLIEFYIRKLNLFYYRTEQDQFFSSLLSIKELNNINYKVYKEKNKIIEGEGKPEENDIVNEIIKKIRKIYLDQINFINNDDNNENHKFEVIENIRANEIKIILGLNLPGIKPIIDFIIKKFDNEILLDYLDNEGHLRETMDGNDEEIYLNNLKKYNDFIFIELSKNNILNEIAKDEFSKSKFYDLFLEDFYILFVYEYLNKKKLINEDQNIGEKEKNGKDLIDYDSIKKFFKLMMEKRKNSKEIYKEIEVASTINWILAYSPIIANILEMFLKLSKMIGNLYKQIENIIKNDKIKYEESRKYRLNYIVNAPIFYGLESILKVTTTKTSLYNKLLNNPKEFSDLIKVNKFILQLAFKMEKI